MDIEEAFARLVSEPDEEEKELIALINADYVAAMEEEIRQQKIRDLSQTLPLLPEAS